MAAKHQKFTIDLSEYPPDEREAIALEVIDQIRKRSKDGLDKNGKPFAPYSKSYKESLDFKIAGKTSSVDLTLSGDMLDSIEILEDRGGKVTIGFQRGSAENGKADGNIRGTYGQDHKVGPARDFLGIQDKELDKILQKYPVGTEKGAERASERLTMEAQARRLSASLNLEDLDLEDLDD